MATPENRMFMDAVLSLAQISEALGIPDEQAATANGNELILDAIAQLRQKTLVGEVIAEGIRYESFVAPEVQWSVTGLPVGTKLYVRGDPACPACAGSGMRNLVDDCEACGGSGRVPIQRAEPHARDPMPDLVSAALAVLPQEVQNAVSHEQMTVALRAALVRLCHGSVYPPNTPPAHGESDGQPAASTPAAKALAGPAQASEEACRAVLADVDPVVIHVWKLQGRTVGAMLREAQTSVEDLMEELEQARDEPGRERKALYAGIAKHPGFTREGAHQAFGALGNERPETPPGE